MDYCSIKSCSRSLNNWLDMDTCNIQSSYITFSAELLALYVGQLNMTPHRYDTYRLCLFTVPPHSPNMAALLQSYEILFGLNKAVQ